MASDAEADAGAAAEAAPPEEQQEDGNNNGDPSPPSYVSPASVDAQETESASQTSPEHPRQLRETINLSRQNSSDSDALYAPPVYQFGAQSSNIYDSDASESSIVFNYPGTPPLTQHHHSRSSRDRFPSFDSLASTGSFRVIGNATPSPTYRVSPQAQQQQQQQQQQQPPPPVQMLPYAQRRKLLQQREQQENQQRTKQQQTQQQQMLQRSMQIPMYGQPMMQPPPHPYGQPPPPPPPQQMYPNSNPEPYGWAYAVPPSAAVPMGMAGGAIPVMAGPPTSFMPPPSSSQYPYQPNVATRPPSSGRSRTPPPPPFSQERRTNSPSKSRQTSSSSQQQQEQGKRKAQLHRSLPPSGPRGRTSSNDSMGGDTPPPRPQRRDGANPLPPPPPPPPPPMNPYHIRADSSGSISSIGSNGSRGASGTLTTLTDRLGNDIAGYLQQEIPPVEESNTGAMQQQHEQQAGPTDGFFSYLSMSPSQQSKVSVKEFHRRNQAFLQQSEHQRSQMMQRPVSARDHSPHRQQQSPSPRASRSHRPGLSSIDNDNWEEESPDGPPASHKGRTARHPRGHHGEEQQHSVDPYHLHYSRDDAARAPRDRSDRRKRRDRSAAQAGDSSSEVSSSYDDSDNDVTSTEGEEATERSSLLPPSGISSYEHGDGRNSYMNEPQGSRDRGSRKSRNGRRTSRRPTGRWADTSKGRSRRNERKRSRRNRQSPELDDDFYRSSSSSSYQNSSRRQRHMQILENERKWLLAQWKAEALAEADATRKEYEANRWDRRFSEYIKNWCAAVRSNWLKLWINLETFISNLPLTLGAVALSIVTLGVVWFKFAEENLDSCQPVHFHSSQCTFPEFPGCFYCDTTARMYKVAVHFHFTCSAIAGILAVVFFAKVFLATRVVLDEMSSPTTASPAGLICMTIVCVFAGRGFVGQVLVSAAAALHLCLAIWFIYMALAFHIMPEPSWFPNTVGIGLSAVKTWLYYPMPGHLLMAVSLSLNFFFFPISLVRVPLNEKMSAPATWIQMSAPAVSLYALTIMAQPSFIEEHPDVTHFQKVHRMVYLPFMHVLFALAVVGMISSVQAFIVRWPSFKTKPFSPAHAAFCFPTLAHANAVQAYRAAVNAFSDMPAKSPFKIALYSYWVTVLVSGTIATIYVTSKFMYHLPGWTQIDVADEDEPPPPSETALTLQHVVTTGETLQQPFVSPAVLQANETGALVMLPSRGVDGRRRYRRTRRLTALGFEPIMNIIEMDHELEVILEYVAKHPPRRRTQTLSVPGIDFNYGLGDFGAGNRGVYDDRRHSRSSTMNFPSARSRSSTLGDDPSQPWGYYG